MTGSGRGTVALRDLAQALGFLVMLVAVQGAVHVVARHVLSAPTRPAEGTAWGDAVTAVAALATCMIYTTTVRLFERRAASELAFDGHAAAMATRGVILGFGLFCVVVAFMIAIGHGSVSGVDSPAGFGLAAAGAAGTAVAEEIMFRGVVFRLLARHLGPGLGVAASAALFGLMHGGSAGSGPLPATAVALEAGVLLSVAFLATGTLWFPIAVHFGWNCAESGVFGTTMSGFESRGLLWSALSGPPWLSGGRFGLEAGLPAVLVCLVAAAVLWTMYRRNRQADRPWLA